MLEKTPPSENTTASPRAKRAAHKRTPAQAAAPPAATHEPKANWVPLWRAPFYCFSNRYIDSPELWADAFNAEIQRRTFQPHVRAPNPNYPELVTASPPEWSWRISKTKMQASISAAGIKTVISPGSVCVHPEGPISLDRWLIGGCSDKVLEDSEWDEIPPDERIAALWHKELLDCLFDTLHSSFVNAVESGAAQIMARKNSVLASFERVTWEQWQFFRLDEIEDPPPAEKLKIWYDPRPFWFERTKRFTCTATSPAGERLYTIYIAPGVVGTESGDREDGAEQKCLQWIAQLLREFPDRAPKPLGNLAKEAISRFPGLSKRGFVRCYVGAQLQTGNRNWSRPGAPPKFLQKSPHKK
jgi:hypothetical protein